MTIQLLVGDCRDVLPTLPDRSVHCVVTSPPYFGLRDYGTGQWQGGDPSCDHRKSEFRRGRNLASSTASTRGGGKKAAKVGWRQYAEECSKCGATREDRQIGLEPTPDEYVGQMVEVFREVRRVLRDDGTLWLNLGDSYANDGKWGGSTGGKHVTALRGDTGIGRSKKFTGLKPKDLIGIPWRVAFALQADGWYLRQDIIWSKPNPMPESVTDRCTKAHEYIFLLSKSARYHYDADAIRETRAGDEDANGFRGGSYVNDHPGPRQATGNKRVKVPGGWDVRSGAHGTIHREGRTEAEYQEAVLKAGRNKRSVWTVATAPFKEAHFATFPPSLIEPCILAGCPEGGTVLDPFGGSGTTGLVADRLGRHAILIELNEGYAEMARRRMVADAPLFAEVQT